MAIASRHFAQSSIFAITGFVALGFALLPGARTASAQAPGQEPGRGPREIPFGLERVENSALAERFAHDDATRGRVVDVMIRGPVSRGALEAMGVSVGTQAGNVTTARMPLASAAQVARLAGVEAVRLATPLKPHNDLLVVDARANTKRTQSPPLAGFNGNNVVVGFIDSGIEYQHDDFKNPDGTTRLLSIWDQNAIGSPPFGYGYGNECTQAQIQAGTCPQSDPVGHGTHVTGIAAGDGSATGNAVPAFKYSGMANKASIVMVKTNFTDTGLLEGVQYIFDKAAGLGQPAVVNMSLGSNLGPHDGTTDLELGLQALVGPGKLLVSSAGNSFGAALHARLNSTAANDSLTFVIPAYTGSAGNPDFIVLDGWYEGTDNYRLQLKSPTGKVFGPISKGANFIAPGSGADPMNADGRVYMENATTPANNGDANLYIEVTDVSGAPRPRSGNWILTVIPVSVVSTGRVHFWCYSELSPTYPDAFFGTRADNDVTISQPATSDSVIAVSAHVTRVNWTSSAPGQPGPWTFNEVLNQIGSFSGSGPRRDNVMKPDLSAPGTAIASVLSTAWVAAGAAFGWDARLAVDDGKHAILQGTSMSAPAVTGALAMMLQQNPTLTPALAKSRLAANTRRDAFVNGSGAVPNKRFGWGKLDLNNILPNVDTVAPLVSLLRPNGGELFQVSSTDTIRWTASDNVGVTAVNLEVSTDNGLNWSPIASGLANSGQYLWPVPNTPSTQARVRVTALDTQNQAQDQSANVFTIQSSVDTTPAPLAFAVHRATPSPFSTTTAIGFDLPGTGAPGGTWRTTVKIYNIAGRLVRVALDSDLTPGPHTAGWDGRDDRGFLQPAGVYFVEVATSEHRGHARAVYLR
ncbi:MAG: S8 family serine peptidase [Candidatus Eiseniibacteriota bacterium]